MMMMLMMFYLLSLPILLNNDIAGNILMPTNNVTLVNGELADY